jgi:hypothetical protein
MSVQGAWLFPWGRNASPTLFWCPPGARDHYHLSSSLPHCFNHPSIVDMFFGQLVSYYQLHPPGLLLFPTQCHLFLFVNVFLKNMGPDFHSYTLTGLPLS